MKKIKIRYIKQHGVYYMEKKCWFGWKKIGRYIDLYYGGIFWRPYTSKNKLELLKEVLNDYYKVDKRFVEIIECPMIKIY